MLSTEAGRELGYLHTTVAETSGSHPESFVRALVEATVGVESCVVDSVCHRLAFAKGSADTFRSVSSAIDTRCQSCARFERSVKMKDTNPYMLGEFLKGWGLFGTLDESAHFLDLGYVCFG